MKRKFAFIFVLLLLLVFTSCATLQTSSTHTDFETAEPDTAENVHFLPGPVTVDYNISYYDIIADKINEFSDSVYFEDYVDPKFFIDKLSDLMQIRINVISVTASNDSMTINFSSDSAPLNGTGAFEESFILESIAETMFEVYESIEYIYYTKDGKEYESGHISLSLNTPYAQRKNENNR